MPSEFAWWNNKNVLKILALNQNTQVWFFSVQPQTMTKALPVRPHKRELPSLNNSPPSLKRVVIKELYFPEQLCSYGSFPFLAQGPSFWRSPYLELWPVPSQPHHLYKGTGVFSLLSLSNLYFSTPSPPPLPPHQPPGPWNYRNPLFRAPWH